MGKRVVFLFLSLLFFGASCSKENKSESGTQKNISIEKKDTKTVAVSAVVLVRNDIPEDEVYAITKCIFDNKDQIALQHAKGKDLDIAFASSIVGIPYHSGSAKYFAEKGEKVAKVYKPTSSKKQKSLSFGTGGSAGSYYGFGGVLSSYISNNTPYSVTATTSGGSKANIENLESGSVQLAFAQSDVISYAYNGQRLFDSPIKEFSVLAALYMEQVQVVTTNPAIESISDLRGKKVSIGDVGSGVYFNAIDVLDAYGITEKDIKPQYLGFSDSAESLKDKKIDAAFVVAGIPTTAVMDLATSKPVYLVGFDEEHKNKLIEKNSFYLPTVIAKDVY